MRSKSSLSTHEWEMLEEINLLIYETPIEDLCPIIIEKLHGLINFSHSLNYFVQYKDGLQESFKYYSPDIPVHYIQQYTEKYIMLDYINWYVRSPGISVFREADVVPENIRLNSPFTTEWMMKIGLFYGAGMMVSRNGIKYSGLFIYRDKNSEDFSDRDIEILSVINERVSRKFYNHYPSGFTTDEIIPESSVAFQSGNQLTEKEKEILTKLHSGVLRSELATELYISQHTLNKHLANIYRKLDINSFEQLLHLLNI